MLSPESGLGSTIHNNDPLASVSGGYTRKLRSAGRRFDDVSTVVTAIGMCISQASFRPQQLLHILESQPRKYAVPPRLFCPLGRWMVDRGFGVSVNISSF